MERLRTFIGRVPQWRTLFSFLPENLRGVLMFRSAIASTFVASLQLVKDGQASIRQDGTFGQIWLRSTPEQDVTPEYSENSGGDGDGEVSK